MAVPVQKAEVSETSSSAPADTISRADLKAALDQFAETLTIEESAAAQASPARHMQNTLGREFADVNAEAVWPLRRTMAFVVCSCGAFWTAMYFVVAALIK